MEAILRRFKLTILQRPSPTLQLQQPPHLRSIATNYDGHRFPKEQPPAPRSRNLPSWAGVSLFPHGTEGVSAATRSLKFKSAVRKKTRSIRIPIVYGVGGGDGAFRFTGPPISPIKWSVVANTPVAPDSGVGLYEAEVGEKRMHVHLVVLRGVRHL